MGDTMEKIKMRSFFYHGIIYISVLGITIKSLLDKSTFALDIRIYLIFLFGSVLMGFFSINSGKVLIDLIDSSIAFIFIIYGREYAVLFVIVYWLMLGIMGIGLRYRYNKGVLFNLCMMVTETYITATIIMHVISYFTNNRIFLSVCFVGVFLLINITLYDLEMKLVEGIIRKFGKETKVLLLLNFIISSLVSALFIIVSKNNNYINCVIVLLIFIAAYHFYLIYRKLIFRSNGIKKLIKITSDMVKYGDFNSKCNQLLLNLKNLIPYEICAIYTLDSETDILLYPISYIAPNNIKIGDLDVNISDNNITAKIIKEGKIYISKDLKKDKGIKASGKLLDFIETAIIAPISIGERVVGFITICGGRDLAMFIDNGVEDILTILSNQMALAVENDSIYRSMRNEADFDYLTKLYNRRAFEKKIDELISTNTMFSMVIYDIDDFKQVNDTYGHLIGDEALKKVGSVIKKSIRKTDIACRYGGEELVILFSNLAKDDAYTISDRIRNRINVSPIEFDEININITVSGGISSFPENGKTREEIISYADELLYNECKSKGKNKVCAYKPN